MPEVRHVPSPAEWLGDTIELADERAGSRVALIPGRGALVTSFRVGSRELLYLDEATLVDPEKNVRGGIPVLFPAPGKLAGDAFVQAGRSGAMKQHGFARSLAWEVLDERSEPSARVTLAIEASDATRATFPWDFAMRLTFALEGAELAIEASVENTGGSRMPFALGYHPYFAVADKAGARVTTDATRAWDNVAKAERAFAGFDLTLPELDLHLLDQRANESALVLADGARVVVRATPELRRWVVWTLGGKGFVCVEPWTAGGDALNTGEGLLWVEPGARHVARVAIRFEAP